MKEFNGVGKAIVAGLVSAVLLAGCASAKQAPATAEAAPAPAPAPAAAPEPISTSSPRHADMLADATGVAFSVRS